MIQVRSYTCYGTQSSKKAVHARPFFERPYCQDRVVRVKIPLFFSFSLLEGGARGQDRV